MFPSSSWFEAYTLYNIHDDLWSSDSKFDLRSRSGQYPDNTTHLSRSYSAYQSIRCLKDMSHGTIFGFLALHHHELLQKNFWWSWMTLPQVTVRLALTYQGFRHIILIDLCSLDASCVPYVAICHSSRNIREKRFSMIKITAFLKMKFRFAWRAGRCESSFEDCTCTLSSGKAVTSVECGMMAVGSGMVP